MPSSPAERADVVQRLGVHEESGWDSLSIASSRPVSPNDDEDGDGEEEGGEVEEGEGEVFVAPEGREAVAMSATAKCNGDSKSKSQTTDAPQPHVQAQVQALIGAAGVGDETRAGSGPARPSLNMTAHEFTEAKTIILDLLGWGVPPDYLVDCGVAREAVYYAFRELNLRLPEGFDTAGIVPYEPPRSVK